MGRPRGLRMGRVGGHNTGRGQVKYRKSGLEPERLLHSAIRGSSSRGRGRKPAGAERGRNRDSFRSPVPVPA